MPRVLSKFPPAPERTRKAPKYDWKTLFDGRVYALTRDEYGQPETFRNAAHSVARRRGIRVRTVMIGNELIIQADSPAIVLERR